MLNLKIFALLILEVEFKMVSSILIIYRVRAVFWLPMTPGALLLHLGDYKILASSYKSYAEHPRFYRFRALGSLQFTLEHSLESMKI